MPLVIPKVYTKEKSWEESIDHFDSVMITCEWVDQVKIKWLCVWLRGDSVQEVACNDFKQTHDDMQNWFKAESKNEFYMAQLQTCVKRRT